MRGRHVPPAVIRTVLAGVLSLLAAGCNLVPEYLRPQAPIPLSYPSETQSSRTAGDWRQTGWRSYFTDPHLQVLIAAALANNRDLRVAALRVEEARALYAGQSASRWPAINLEATTTRPRAAGGAYSDQFGMALSAYELDFFGRVKSLSDAALHEYLGTEQARRAAEISLVAEIARAYVLERTSATRLALARRTLASRTASVDLTAQRERAGLASTLDLRQAQSLIGPAEADIVEQQLAQSRARHSLALLTGYTDLPAPLPEAQLDDRWGGIEPGLPSDLLTFRPDILAAEERLKAANAQIGAARAAFFPSIRLTAMGGLASDSFGKLFNAQSGAWQFAPQVSLPIFDAGRNEANLALARIRKDLALAEYEKAIQVAFREVADVLAGQTLLERDLAVRIQIRDGEASRLALTTTRYQAGSIGYLDMLDAERGLFAAEQQLVDARRARLDNAINLYRALGGGHREERTSF